MKKTLLVILSILLITPNTFSQIIKKQKYNQFSGTAVLSVESGATLALTDYSGLGVDYLGKLSIEYFFPASVSSGFGLRLFVNAGFISGDDPVINPAEFRSNITTFGGGAIFILSINDILFPYMFAGIANLSFDPKGEGGLKLPNNQAGVYGLNEINYVGELGVRYPVTENLSANFDVGVQISPNDFLDDKGIDTGSDLFFTVMTGISYSFLTEFDTDGDGVVDSKDICPGTPFDIRVYESGCPVDNDKDGVGDYMDECPATPSGVKVDEKGCPLDSDNDDIPDYTDLCPGTQKGVEVDDYGCPFDTDTDGIPDYLDKCPDTPFEVEVDLKGCPKDSDLDGVPDYLDQCPETLPGKQVDERGCEIFIAPPDTQAVSPQTGIEQIVLSSETSFEFNSAQLKPAAFPELEKILAEMKKYPTSRWRIEGHTDNVGSEDGNIKMSIIRAESVLGYFVSGGIATNRFEVMGFGSKIPVADNKTPEGRTKNRRVEIIRIDKH